MFFDIGRDGLRKMRLPRSFIRGADPILKKSSGFSPIKKTHIGMVLQNALAFAKTLTRKVVRSGDVVVDATVGNGHDTSFLAEMVGDEGQVFGFDVQERAIAATRDRLKAAGYSKRTTLFKRSHAELIDALPERFIGEIKAVMFNLGYLPGADKSIITQKGSTLSGLRAALDVMSPGGLLTVVLYTGHPGGKEEAEAVEAWAISLDPKRYHAMAYRFLNQPNDPPWLISVEKRG